MRIPFGMLLKMAHVCAVKNFGSLRMDCYDMISSNDPPESALLENRAYEFWKIFTSCVLSSGPFAEVYKLRNLDDLVSRLYYFFPRGPPMRGQKWEVGNVNYEKKEEIFDCIRELCGRSCPVPISSRWYSVERTCLHFLPLIIFGLLPKCLIYACKSMLCVAHLAGRCL